MPAVDGNRSCSTCWSQFPTPRAGRDVAVPSGHCLRFSLWLP